MDGACWEAADSLVFFMERYRNAVACRCGSLAKEKGHVNEFTLGLRAVQLKSR